MAARKIAVSILLLLPTMVFVSGKGVRSGTKRTAGNVLVSNDKRMDDGRSIGVSEHLSRYSTTDLQVGVRPSGIHLFILRALQIFGFLLVILVI